MSMSLCCIPDLQVQDQQTPISNVLETPGQVTQGLENLFPAAFSNNLAVC